MSPPSPPRIAFTSALYRVSVWPLTMYRMLRPFRDCDDSREILGTASLPFRERRAITGATLLFLSTLTEVSTSSTLSSLFRREGLLILKAASVSTRFNLHNRGARRALTPE